MAEIWDDGTSGSLGSCAFRGQEGDGGIEPKPQGRGKERKRGRGRGRGRERGTEERAQNLPGIQQPTQQSLNGSQKVDFFDFWPQRPTAAAELVNCPDPSRPLEEAAWGPDALSEPTAPELGAPQARPPTCC